jgi:hypothetical protein
MPLTVVFLLEFFKDRNSHMARCAHTFDSPEICETVNNRPLPTSRVASFDGYLFLVLLFYALVVVGMSYILIRVYRERTRKVRKLR